MLTLTHLSRAKTEYDKYASAIMQAQTVGYGIVTPATEELTLEEPELIKQGGRYGIRLKARPAKPQRWPPGMVTKPSLSSCS